jgi:hypothetical protein
VVPARQDFFNPQGNPWQLQQIPPQVLTFTATYTMQKFAFLKAANLVTKDWQIGYFGNYQSGTFLTPPTTGQFATFLPSQAIRVPGVPLYNKDINDIHNYNPYYDQVLNPAAWKQVPVNQVGPAVSTLYSDFRGPRQPHENANIGRHFRFKEKFDLYIRGEFVNIFNRTLMPNPISTNPQNPLTKNGLGIYTGGFGVINAYNAPGSNPTQAGGSGAGSAGTALIGRSGTLIARFQF